MARSPEFRVPEGLCGRFAIVKLRTNLKTAEDEVIERIKRTAASLGLHCFVVDFKGRVIGEDGRLLTSRDVDFVIHLHFETPKCYDIFSFAALWNPLQFFYDWGYRQYSRNVVTHDDFLSCSSDWADDHIRRLTHRDPTRIPIELRMYHSLSEPILAPQLEGKKQLFYAGMNWEKLTGQKSRHEELLARLDSKGLIRIYGPAIVQGIRIWEGYEGYAGEVPFDGVSMVHEIAKCGVSLVFSSAAHKESGLMSNRLFEALAAGAIAICDEISFAPKFFGDSLLYVDSTLPVEEVCDAVIAHLEWIDSHPQEAFEKARQAQSIFLERFSLDKNLTELYQSLPARKERLRRLSSPARNERIALFFLAPGGSDEEVDRHLVSIRAQTYPAADFTIVTSVESAAAVRSKIEREIGPSGPRVTVRAETFRRRCLGAVLTDVLREAGSSAELFCFVAPHERLFSDHLQRLAWALERNPSARAAVSDLLLSSQEGTQEVVTVSGRLEYLQRDVMRPFGFGRFLFRRSGLPEWVWATLPYLNGMTMQALLFGCEVARSWRATLDADTGHPWWVAFSAGSIEKELEILEDIFEDFESAVSAEKIEPKELSLARMQPAQRAALAEQIYAASPPAALEPKSLSFRRLSRQMRYDLALALYAAASPDEMEPRRFSLDRLEEEDLVRLARQLKDAAGSETV